jgi:hypothetical protein
MKKVRVLQIDPIDAYYDLREFIIGKHLEDYGRGHYRFCNEEDREAIMLATNDGGDYRSLYFAKVDVTTVIEEVGSI